MGQTSRWEEIQLMFCSVMCWHVLHNIHVLSVRFCYTGLVPPPSNLFLSPSFTSYLTLFCILFLPFTFFLFFLFHSSISRVLSPYTHTLNTHFSLLLLHSLPLVEDRAGPGRHWVTMDDSNLPIQRVENKERTDPSRYLLPTNHFTIEEMPVIVRSTFISIQLVKLLELTSSADPWFNFQFCSLMILPAVRSSGFWMTWFYSSLIPIVPCLI